SRGLSNAFAEREPTLLIPAIDLNTAERVVFGAGALRDVPISQAVAASSAIPGFFDPYPINGRDYVDGGTGFSGHADLAAEAGAAALRLRLDEGVVGRAGRTAHTPHAARGRLAALSSTSWPRGAPGRRGRRRPRTCRYRRATGN